MAEIEIHQTMAGVGFAGKPEERSMQGFEFDDGKIAYIDSEEIVRTADSEKLLIKALKKEARCIDASVVRKAVAPGGEREEIVDGHGSEKV